MPEEETATSVALEAKSPFELRVHLSRSVTDADAKTALETGQIGFLHSFTTGSTVDGPGVRLVAWTSGCMFQCRYCHNPDTWDMKNGLPVKVESATEELKKYRHSLKIMSGGLTISGGEPLMQHRFVMNIFRAAKAMNIHTALDTNGYLGGVLKDEDLNLVDMVLLDLKSWDTERHRRLTGMDPEPIRQFARRLASNNKRVWVRFVLVPGVTDDQNDIRSTAKFAASLGNVERVDVLPFHQMGRFKWKELRMKYTLDDVEPPSNNVVSETVERFRSEGLTAY